MGLLNGSFRPPQHVCAVRSLLRHREGLVQAATQQTLLMQKSLDQMNLQLHHVLGDITGSSGLAILDAILAGERNTAVLASLRDQRVKSSAETIEHALEGDYRSEHLFTLGQALQLYRFLERQIGECQEAIRRELAGWESLVDLLARRRVLARPYPRTRTPLRLRLWSGRCQPSARRSRSTDSPLQRPTVYVSIATGCWGWT
jgi:hypothetical protein